MRERVLIFVGSAIFVAVVHVPDVACARPPKYEPRQPELKLPANARQCVAPVEYMRASHMQLLIAWREDVVRAQRAAICRV